MGPDRRRRDGPGVPSAVDFDGVRGARAKEGRDACLRSTDRIANFRAREPVLPELGPRRIASCERKCNGAEAFEGEG